MSYRERVRLPQSSPPLSARYEAPRARQLVAWGIGIALFTAAFAIALHALGG